MATHKNQEHSLIYAVFDYCSTRVKVPKKKKDEKKLLISIVLLNLRKHNMITQPCKLPEKVHFREVQSIVLRCTAFFACIEVIQLLLHKMLSSEGFTVKVFFSGDTARCVRAEPARCCSSRCRHSGREWPEYQISFQYFSGTRYRIRFLGSTWYTYHC